MADTLIQKSNKLNIGGNTASCVCSCLNTGIIGIAWFYGENCVHGISVIRGFDIYHSKT